MKNYFLNESYYWSCSVAIMALIYWGLDALEIGVEARGGWFQNFTESLSGLAVILAICSLFRWWRYKKQLGKTKK